MKKRSLSMEASLRMALNSGLAEKADQEIINGSKGLLNGSNLGAHNVAAVYGLRGLPLGVLLRPSRWPLCDWARHAPYRDGQWHLRACRHGLQIE